MHVRVPSLDAARLRRPFSIYDADPMTGRLHILYKTVGLGTRHLAALPVGPIGRPFPLKPEGIPYLIGGGYGVAPLWFLASRLPRKGILFVGGRTAADILETDRFEEAGWEVRIATQDGSRGTMGLVTAPLDAALADKPQAELYACGPDGMLRAVAVNAPLPQESKAGFRSTSTWSAALALASLASRKSAVTMAPRSLPASA